MAIRGPAGISISNTGILLICVCSLMLFIYTFRGSISEGTSSIYGSKYDREYKVSEVLSAAIYLTEKAGRLVRDIREKDALDEQSKGETREGVNDPLTEGDLQSHRILVKGFKKAFPALNLVSEEHEEESVDGVIPPSLFHPDVQKLLKSDPSISAEDITVWVDPLDATKEYTERLTQYVTVMACVAVKGVPVAGVIRKPFEDKTYWAWVGHGVSDTLRDMHGSSEGDTLEVIVSLSHKGEVEDVAQKAFAPRQVHITGAGGAGYKTIEVVKGTEDVYVHTTLIKKWDICAGDAILRAIGGTQTDLRGDEINYSHNLDPKNEHGLIATMHNHEDYRKVLQAAAKS
ncbi:hypothetical protein ACHWQZ_G011775 [Mnemiopsis leidyi]